MSVATPSAGRVLTAAPSRSLVPTLAGLEAKRLLLHPLTLFGMAIFVINGVRAVVVGNGPRAAFETVDSMLSFYPGVFMILVGGLVATRDRRADSREMLAPVPGRLQERTLALALASASTALAGLVLVVALHIAFLLDDRYIVAPGPWHLLQAPVTLMGGTLLGVMVATWAPARSTAVLTMVVMVALNVWLNGQESLHLLGPMVSWAEWGATPQAWVGLFDGSPGWHVVYLLGLCGMAASAAVLRVAERRTPVVVLGIAALVVAVLGGTAQLP